MSSGPSGLITAGAVAAGPRALAVGFRLIVKPGIRVFVIVPLIINVSVFVALGTWAGRRWEGWMDRAMASLPGWLQWLEALAWVLFAALALLAVVYGFTLVANLIASPFNGFLSERVERYCGGKPQDGHGVLAEAALGVATELRKLAWIGSRLLGLAVVSLILLFVPVLNALIPVLWLVFGAYALALEYFDFPMSNHGYDFAAKRRWLRSNRALSLSFGGSVTALTLVPFVNLMVMPAAIAGATALWVERERRYDPLSPAGNGRRDRARSKSISTQR